MYNLNYNIFYNSMLALSRKRWPGQAWLIAWTHSFPRKLITECLVTKKTQMGWEGLDCVDLRTCYLKSVYGNFRSIKFCQCGKAWASVKSGVQHALASYCMLRFQRSSKSRCLSSSSTYDTMILAECFSPKYPILFLTISNSGLEGKAWRRSKTSSMQSWRLGIWHPHSLFQLKCWNYFRYSCRSFFHMSTCTLTWSNCQLLCG